MELNHIPPNQPNICHASLGPKHEMFMIPTPSLHSQPLSRGIIIKEEKLDYTDFLFQDSQDPYEDFTPVPSPSPSPYEFPDHPLLHIRHFPHSLIIFLSQLLHHQKVNIALGHVFQDVLIQKKSSRKAKTLIVTLTRQIFPHPKTRQYHFKEICHFVIM